MSGSWLNFHLTCFELCAYVKHRGSLPFYIKCIVLNQKANFLIFESKLDKLRKMLKSAAHKLLLFTFAKHAALQNTL